MSDFGDDVMRVAADGIMREMDSAVAAKRLRRLDALFAEKVLGLTEPRPLAELVEACGGVRPSSRVSGSSVAASTICMVLSGQRNLAHDTEEALVSALSSESLPRYTRSLDAAWEGAQSLLGERLQSVSICVPEKGESCVYSASLDDLCSKADATFSDDQYGTSMAHPAEALVLACLRAVGVSEEELG